MSITRHRMERRWIANSEGVRVQIEHAGIGIASVDLGKVFEAFYQAQVGVVVAEGKGASVATWTRRCLVPLEGWQRVRRASDVGSMFAGELIGPVRTPAKSVPQNRPNS